MGSSSRSEDEASNKVGGNSLLNVPESTSGHGHRPYSPVAETLFRKDLISAMKLPDNEPLAANDYWIVTDTWKQEWEKGVQVPVRPEELPEPRVSRLKQPPHSATRFQYPRKLMCMSRSGVYTSETHQVTPMALRSEQVCSYDLDDMDQRWITAFNGERALCGQQPISEIEMERTMEELERQCHEKINSTIKSNEEAEDADDGVICDVCRSPDSEDTNVMVFCEKCNICVHQACYGITSIPSGPWLCKTCTLGKIGIKPKCELCPNRGGAMKSNENGTKWAHVSCALWIPEVSMGCVEKMEPIEISSIPPSRWNLVCVLCKEKVGCCIQCSVKACKSAYHVTCSFKRGLEMKVIFEDENAEDGVQLRSYCQNHSLNKKRRDSEDSDDDSKKKHMTTEERNHARWKKMVKIECEFYKHVDLSQASRKVGLDQDLVDFIFRYWLLKRKSAHNKPLLAPRSDEVALLSSNQDTERDKLKKFVALRQDLERIRNLCYMVSKREKLQRSFVKLREQILAKQLQLLDDKNCANQMTLMEMSAVLEANHGPTVYDRLFSHSEAEIHTENDYEVIISRISGEIAENSAQIRKDNPYRKLGGGLPFDNQKTVSYERIFSDMSASETEDLLNISANLPHHKKQQKQNKSGVNSVRKTKKNQKKPTSRSAKPSNNKGSHASSKRPLTRSSDTSDVDSTSSTDEKDISKKNIRNSNVKSSIFSDTDSDGEDSKSRPKSPVFVRTKAAMKDFSVDALSRSRLGKDKKPSKSASKQSKSTSSNASSLFAISSSHSKNSLKASNLDSVKRNRMSSDSPSDFDSDKEVVPSSNTSSKSKSKIDKESDFYPMIVPERAAAKKATAKLRVGNQDSSKPPVTENFDFSHLVNVKMSKKNSQRDKIDLISDEETEMQSSSSSRKTKKQRKVDLDTYGFVPERKAAKKASAHLKEGGKVISQYREELFFGNLSPKKTPGRPRKKETTNRLLSLSERIREHSDSDEEPFPCTSPPGKIPRGRGGAPKSPRKSAPKVAAPKPVKNKVLPSGVEAFLKERDSQLDDILYGLSTSKSKREPDKKLKTSEGHPEHELGVEIPSENRDVQAKSSEESSSSSSSGSSSSSEDEAPSSPARREASKPPTTNPTSVSSPKTTPRPSDQLTSPRRGTLNSVSMETKVGVSSPSKPISKFPNLGEKETEQPSLSLFSPSRSPFSGSDKESPIQEGAPLTPGRESMPEGRDGKHFTFSPTETARQEKMAEKEAVIKSPPNQVVEESTKNPSRNSSRSEDLTSRKLSIESKDSDRDSVSKDVSVSQDVEKLRKDYQEEKSGTKQGSKQTDDSGFDSDEKAQQQIQAASNFNDPAASLTNNLPNSRDSSTSERVNKHNHMVENQQQHQHQQQSNVRVSDQERLDQMTAQIMQHNRNRFSDLESFQREHNEAAFYNYMYDFQRNATQRMQFASQNNPMASQYALQQQQQQMKMYGQKGPFDMAQYEFISQQLYANPQLLQNPQFLQQYMALCSGGSNNYVKDFPFAWANQGQMNKMMSQHMPNQKQANTAASKSSSQQPQSSSTHANYQKESHSYPSNFNDPITSLASSVASVPKVQNTSSSSSSHHHFRRTSKDSPNRRPAQSPRGGGAHLQQAPSSDHSSQSTIPSATPSESLPGHAGSVNKASDSQQENFPISKDLLDTVNNLHEIPVWKPNSEKNSVSSPRKSTPNDRNSSDSVQRRNSRDKSFEDLVKKVEASPAHKSDTKTNNNKQSRLLQELTPKQQAPSHTPAHSESKESRDQSMSDADYDDTKGGVDYDDSDDEFRPSQIPGKPKRGRAAKAGRGIKPRGGGSFTFSKGRGRGRTKLKPIDTKALEKVHRQVAGTDYDFENEFEDDFGDVKTPDLSLQALREQTKRQNLMLDAKKEQERNAEIDSKSIYGFSEGFEDPKVVVSEPKKSAVASKPKGRTPRGRAKKNVNKVSLPAEDLQNIEPKEEPQPPKLPKLKIGHLLIKKDSPKGSPKVSKSKTKDNESKDSPKIHRKSSVDSEGKKIPIPKLTIKIGPKPPSVNKVEETKPKEDLKVEVKEGAKTAKADKAEKEEKSAIESTSEISAKDPTKSSPVSPSKKVCKIDMLANILAAKHQSSSNDLDSIFGPTGGPLDMSTASENPSGTSIQPEEKSELDLLQEEMKNFEKNYKSEAAPPKKAVTSNLDSNVDDSTTRSQHLKMKFKVKTTSDSVTPQAGAPIDTNIQSQSGHPRMRKKEILNKYFGGDAYPAPNPTNGPTSVPVATEQPAQPARNLIKMPKAVASVTSVPTRADYQHQMEAAARKRKRDKGLEQVGDRDSEKGGKGGERVGKRKKNRGKQNDEDGDYKPKTSVEANKNEEKKDNGRKTRGKPPKKCLAESPTHDLESGDLKAESMKFGEAMLASFDTEQAPKSTVRRTRKRKKGNSTPPNDKIPMKTPKLVIKFSKDSVSKANSDKSATPTPPLSAASKVDSKNNGLDAFDFEENEKNSLLPQMVDGNIEMNMDNVKKIKIKV